MELTYLDAWTHILPSAYFERLKSVSSATGPLKRWMNLVTLFDLDERFRLMDAFPGYAQILTPSMPAFDELEGPDSAAGLARVMNDGLAHLVRTFPDRFPYFAAGISLQDKSRAQDEIQHALSLGAIGFQLPTHVNGTPLDHPDFSEIWDTLASTGRPIWLHPLRGPLADYPSEERSKYEIWWCFGWPYDSTVAMSRIVLSGLLDRHPHLRIVTHHCGAMIPYFSGRIEQGWGLEMGARTPPGDAGLLPGELAHPIPTYFRSFIGDTALSGADHALRCGLDYFGVDNVVFASDFPFDAEGGAYLVRETCRSIESLSLPQCAFSKLMSENARALTVPSFEDRLQQRMQQCSATEGVRDDGASGTRTPES